MCTYKQGLYLNIETIKHTYDECDKKIKYKNG